MAEIPVLQTAECNLNKTPGQLVVMQDATEPAAVHKDATDDDERWATDPENARNWSASRKVFVTALVSMCGFISALNKHKIGEMVLVLGLAVYARITMASPIYSPGSEQVAAQFRVSTTVAILPISLYNVGMAFGPVIASPLSETFGRRVVYLVVGPVFALFVLGSGFSQNIAQLCVCRFFAGTFASPSVAIASATIADMFAPADRAYPLILYYTTPTLGALTGPLIGGFVVDAKGWRWSQWTTLFFAVAIFPLILLVRESYKKTILQRRASSRRHASGLTRTFSTVSSVSPATFLRRASTFFRTTLVRPLHMLLTEPIVSLLCLYMGFQFGLLYCFVVAAPYVFSTVYNFQTGAQGLVFLGFIGGLLAGSAFLMLLHRTVYVPAAARFHASHHDKRAAAAAAAAFPPENRLLGAQAGSVALPAGLFWFAWAARPDVHWLCPVAAQALVMFGSITVYIPAGMYMMDTYGARFGASANGASSLLRYSLAAAFPLFTLRLFDALGVGWACSLLGFCTLAMAPIPWAFGRWGPGLRAASRYQKGD